MMQREFTGKTMAATLIGGFGIVMAVNFYMASLAIGGFGGVVVENSYVASQKFNGWLEQGRTAQQLGYEVDLTRDAGGFLHLATRSVPRGVRISAELRRPLNKPEHTQVGFVEIAPGRFVSRHAIAPGRWIARLAIVHGEQRWVRETELP